MSIIQDPEVLRAWIEAQKATPGHCAGCLREAEEMVECIEQAVFTTLFFDTEDCQHH